MELLDDESLEASAVVANNAMNRERGATGTNSYAKDLGVDPVEFLRDVARRNRGCARWLDLCCGSGRAATETAESLRRESGTAVQIVGVDLVDAFSRIPPAVGHMVRFEVGSVLRWEPDEADFDLVTCVHGLHYVGDKLGAIARAASWLRPQTGLFQANFDLKSVLVGGKAGTLASRWLRRHGFHVDPRKRVISARGRREVSVPWAYSGADDRAGPNYTGQPAVNSHYAELQ